VGPLAGPAALPGRALLPLHTGAGLGLAERLLGALDRAPAAAAGEVVRRWLQRCGAELRPGYADLAVEALGLVAGNLEPWRLGRLGAILGAVEPALAELLWHGFGRGLYFAPVYLVPTFDTARRAFAKTWNRPPDAPGRRNAGAGLAWAATLVNIRHPEVVEAFLAACSGMPESDGAVSHGAASALLLWASWAGEDPSLAHFFAYSPAAPERARRWRRLVVEPGRRALARLDPMRARRERLVELFRLREMP
jgi:hypothetical protein